MRASDRARTGSPCASPSARTGSTGTAAQTASRRTPKCPGSAGRGLPPPPARPARNRRLRASATAAATSAIGGPRCAGRPPAPAAAASGSSLAPRRSTRRIPAATPDAHTHNPAAPDRRRSVARPDTRGMPIPRHPRPAARTGPAHDGAGGVDVDVRGAVLGRAQLRHQHRLEPPVLHRARRRDSVTSATPASLGAAPRKRRRPFVTSPDRLSRRDLRLLRRDFRLLQRDV